MAYWNMAMPQKDEKNVSEFIDMIERSFEYQNYKNSSQDLKSLIRMKVMSRMFIISKILKSEFEN